MNIQLSAVDTVIWSDQVEVLQPDGVLRTCRGKEELDLCSFDDAIQIMNVANVLAPTFDLVLIYGNEKFSVSQWDSNKLNTTYNPDLNTLIANNQPCMGDGAAENITYLYLQPGGPRAFHIINQARGIDVWCGRMWRAWTGQQGMAIKNFGAGDTLVWA